jgi:hypothetical protein
MSKGMSLATRRLPILLAVALVLQLVLLVVLGTSGGPAESLPPETPLLAESLDGVDRLEIEAADGQNLQLVKLDGGWQLPDYFAAPVASDKVDRLLQRLADVERGRPVATSAEALVRFRVSEEGFERRVRLHRGDELVDTLYLGGSPGLRRSFARAAEDRAIYAVKLAAFELPTEPDDWLDSAVLGVDTEAIAEIGLSDGTRLKRTADSWRAEGLEPSQSFDPAAAEALAMRLGGLQVDSLLATERPQDLIDAEPDLRLSARDTAGTEFVWSLWQQGEDGRYVLKRDDRPWYAELARWSAEPLLEAAQRPALLVDEAGPSGGHQTTADPPIAPAVE